MASSTRGSRQPAAQTRSEMLDLAVNRLLSDGAVLDLANISVEELMRSAGAPRSTVFRLWPDRDAFIADLIAALFADDLGFEEAFELTAERVEELASTFPDDQLHTPEGLRDAIRRVLTEALPRGARIVGDTPARRLYKSAIAAVVSNPDLTDRDRVLEVLGSFEDRLLDSVSALLTRMLAVLHLQMRDGLTVRDMGVLLASMVEGVGERRLLLPDNMDRSRQLAPDGDLVGEWPLHTIGITAVMLSMTRPIDDDGHAASLSSP